MAGKAVDWKRVAARMNGVVQDWFYGHEKYQCPAHAFNNVVKIYDRALSREKATKSRKGGNGK